MLRRKGGASRRTASGIARPSSVRFTSKRVRMLVVARCWVSGHAAIASKSKDTEAATLDEARRNYEKSSRNCISTNFDGLLRCGHYSARRYGWNATHVQ